MYPETIANLALADRNRDLANEMMGLSFATPSYGWVTVVAFYAAVHYINAYLFEKDNKYVVTSASGGHSDRTDKVRTLPDLKSAFLAYRHLTALAYDARYVPARALMSRTAAEEAMQDMEDIERTVMHVITP